MFVVELSEASSRQAKIFCCGMEAVVVPQADVIVQPHLFFWGFSSLSHTARETQITQSSRWAQMPLFVFLQRIRTLADP
jgi:hypothetical protein